MVLLLIIALLFFPVISFGVDDEGKSKRIYQLHEIEVSEDVLKEDVETPNRIVVIPELLLQGLGTTLDSALTRQPGIDVQRPQVVGGALDDESIKIRGFGSRRIVFTIDGRTMNTSGTAGGYFIDWTTIPLNNIEKIEVIKGVSDPKYGNTLGGVINLVTRKPKEKPVFEIQAGIAEFDTKTANFYHGWKPGAFEYSISGGYSESDGYLRNGNFRIANINLHLGYEFPWKGKLTGDAQYVEVKKGFIVRNRASNDYDSPGYNTPIDPSYPSSDGEIMYGGMGASPEMGSWWKKEKLYYSIAYEQPLHESILNLRYWKNNGDREAYNTRAALNRVFHKKFYDDRSYGFDASYKHFFKGHTVTAGFDYKRFKDDGDKNYPDDFRAAFRNENYVNSDNIGFFIMDDISITDKLILTPGVRYMSYDGNAGPSGKVEGINDISMSGLSPSIKITYNYKKDGLAYFSIARALRMPTPPEHYWHYSPDAGVDTSNLPFKKEDGLMLQAGWKTTLPSNTRIEISPYYYIIKDYIHFDLINFVSYNIDRATIYGVEMEAAQQLTKGLSAFINYTYQKSKTKGDPFVSSFVAAQDRGFDEIPSLPEHKINAGLQYKGSKKERLAMYASYVSNQKVIYNNNVIGNTNLRVREQKSYIACDVEGAYPILKDVEVIAFGRNIFNETYQERFGFPAAERYFGIGIKAVF